MGRPIRFYERERFYLVTNRCVGGQCYFLPDKSINQIIWFWLIRSIHRFQIDMVAFVFMGNHFHFVLRAPLENLSQFMCYFQRNLSVHLRVERACEDSMFPKRFHCRALMNRDEVRDAVLYVYLNPLRAGLTTNLDKWRGVTSWHLRRGVDPFVLDTGGLHVGSLISSYDAYEGTLSVYALQLSTDDLEKAWIQKQMKRFKAPQKTMSTVDWTTRYPLRTSKRSIRKAQTSERQAYRKQVREVTICYRHATSLWRQGHHVTFPVGTIPPGCQDTVKLDGVLPPSD